MFCEKCGFQIDDDSVFCEKCGEKVILSVDVNNQVNLQTSIQTAVPQKAFWNKKYIFIATALVLVVTVVLVCCLYFSGVGKKSIETTSESTTSTSIFEPTKLKIEESDYLGYWIVDDITHGELVIKSITDDEVSFNIWFVSSGSVSGVVPIDGNVANFTYYDDVITVEGTLIFDESSITVDITKSNYDDLPIGAIVFNSKYSESWVDRLGNSSDVSTEHASLSVSEAKVIVEELKTAYQKIEYISVGGIQFSEDEQYFEPNKRDWDYCAVTDPHYKSINDIQVAFEAVFTKSYAEEQYMYMFSDDFPKYIERNGKLYVAAYGTGGHGLDWKIDTLTIKTQSPDSALIEMDAEDYMDGTIGKVSLEIRKENGKWLLDSIE